MKKSDSFSYEDEQRKNNQLQLGMFDVSEGSFKKSSDKFNQTNKIPIMSNLFSELYSKQQEVQIMNYIEQLSGHSSKGANMRQIEKTQRSQGNKQKSRQMSKIFQQLYIYRFIKKLRIKSNNSNLYQIQKKSLLLINDPTLFVDQYQYQPSGFVKLVVHNQQYIQISKIKVLKSLKKRDQYNSTILKRIYFNFQVQKMEIYCFLGRIKSCILSLRVIQPNNLFVLFLDILVLIITMIELLIIPYYLGFLQFSESEEVCLIKTIRFVFYIILIIDIFMRFNIGYYKEGQIIIHRQQIAQNYLNNSFFSDLITVLPQILNWIFFNWKAIWMENSQLIFLARYFQQYKYINSFVEKIDVIFDLSDFTQNILALIKLWYILIYSAHLISCLWFEIGMLQEPTSWYQVFIKPEDTQFDLYIKSLYWALTTMLTVGYGDIVPITSIEKIYTIMTMLLGCCLFAYIMNSIGALVDQIKNKDADLRNELKLLNKHLDSKEVSINLKTQMRQQLYHLHLQKNNQNFDGSQLIKIFPSDIQQRYLKEINSKVITTTFLSKLFSSNLLEAIIYILKEQIYIPGQQIQLQQLDMELLETKDISLGLISNGSIQKSFNQSGQIISVYKVKQYNFIHCQSGESIGNIPFFTESQFLFTYTCLTISHVQFLSRNQFTKLLRDKYHQDYQRFVQAKDEIKLYKDQSSLKCFCPVCYKPSHHFIDCPLIHLSLDIQRVIRTNKEGSFNDRQQYFRSQKRINTLQKLKTIQAEGIVYFDENFEEIQNLYSSLFSFQQSTSSLQSINLDQLFTDEIISIDQLTPTKNAISQIKISILGSGNQIDSSQQVKSKKKIPKKSVMIAEPEMIEQVRSKKNKKTLSSVSKFSQLQQTKIHFSFYLIEDFDVGEDFSDYFPHNNLKNVINQLKKMKYNRQKQKQSTSLKDQQIELAGRKQKSRENE